MSYFSSNVLRSACGDIVKYQVLFYCCICKLSPFPRAYLYSSACLMAFCAWRAWRLQRLPMLCFAGRQCSVVPLCEWRLQRRGIVQCWGWGVRGMLGAFNVAVNIAGLRFAELGSLLSSRVVAVAFTTSASLELPLLSKFFDAKFVKYMRPPFRRSRKSSLRCAFFYTHKRAPVFEGSDKVHRQLIGLRL